MLSVGFIGYGSIAKRHISNLTKILQKKGISYEICLLRSGLGQIESDEQLKEVDKVMSVEEGKEHCFDILFLTNPTAYHLNTLQQFSHNARAYFIEKPVFHKADIDLKTLGLQKDQIVYVACPLRYHVIIQKVKELLREHQIFSVRSICSSYLPEWRPGTDYRKCYSANRDLGGGVHIDLIHEWDYLTFLFGFPTQILTMRDKISDLEINSDDIAIYIAKYPEMMAEVHLDYLGREGIRQLELFTSKDTIQADLIKSEIRFLKSGTVISLKENRDDYQKRELIHFLSIVEGKATNDNDLDTAIKVLKIVEGNI